MSGRTDEQNRSFLFRDTTFAFQADRKSLYMLRFLHRLEANLRNTILIYANNPALIGSLCSASTAHN
jgi:hypothetical protein